MNAKTLFIFIFVAHFFSISNAEVTFDPIFTDGMVLQRDMNITVQGSGESGTLLNLELHDQTKTTTVGSDGRWKIRLDPLPTSLEPTELTITAGQSTVVLRDVLVGDVWLCSGQSNMGFKLASCTGGKEASEAASDSYLRVNDYRDSWIPCVSETAAKTSGVAYFFARKLRQDNPNVPVGIMVRASSGTPIEWWTPEQALGKIEFCRETMSRFGAETEAGKKIRILLAAEALWKRNRRKLGDNRKAIGKNPPEAIPQQLM